MRAHPFHHPLLLALGAILLLTTHTLALPLYFTVVNHQIRPFGLDLSGKDAAQGAAISSLISQGMIGGIKIRLPRPNQPRVPVGRGHQQQQQRLVAPGQPAQGQKAYSITGALTGTAPGPIAAAPAPGGPGGPPQLQLQAPAAQTLPPNKASVQIGGNQFFFRRRRQAGSEDGAVLEDGEDGEDGEDDWEEEEDEEDWEEEE